MQKISSLFFLSFLLLTSSLFAQCWQSVSAGGNHTLAIRQDGSLWASGFNANGQIGVGNYQVYYSLFTLVNSQNQWKAVAAGEQFSLAIRQDHTLWSWGNNYFGQLGTNTSEDNVPTPHQIGTHNDWEKIAAGNSHAIALKKDGTLWSWGSNFYGQLGDGTTTSRTAPVQIGTDNNWKEIAAGHWYNLGIKKDGTLWAWGANTKGGLGDGTVIHKYIPTQIGNANNWKTIAAGNAHSLAIKQDGTLWTWGYNISGQLGNGTTNDTNIPAQIGSANNWQGIECGGTQTIAFRSDGTLWTWGNNYYGELGNGNNQNSSIPVTVGIPNNWSAISAGWHYSFALKNDGTLFGFGINAEGELGNGTATNTNIPVIIPCTSLSLKDHQPMNVLVYPNPTSDIINIPDNNQPVNKINIYDLSGKLIRNYSGNTAVLSLNPLAKGMYTIEILYDNSTVRQKIMKL